MKTSWLAVLLISSASLHSQDVVQKGLPDYTIASRSAHENVWVKVSWLTNELGEVQAQTNSFEEIATGLNYWDATSQQWKESREEIIAFPGGAAATNGQHQVIFASDLASAAAIDMQTPDGKRLQSRILGLSYQDSVSGSNVLIAELKSSVRGVIIPPNQVLYADAFTDFKADVLYTYTKAGFEQDIILRQRPPLPEVFGLSSAFAVLQVLTEFESAPVPTTVSTVASAGTDFALPDQTLDFGAMKIGSGKAFAVGQDPLAGISVAKEWTTLEGRTFLVEQIRVAAIAEQLDRLPIPKQASLKPANGSVRYVVSNKRLLPARKMASLKKGEMKTARLSASEAGFVLDYLTINTSQANKVFQGDTTYYLSGNVTLTGTNATFEAGTVLKYATNVTLTVNTPVTWLGTGYRPVIMVSKDDKSVGETITGATGTPTNYLASKALYFDATTANTNLVIQNLRVGQAQTAVAINGGNGHVLSHVQLVTCGYGLALTNTDVSLRNALFDHVLTNFTGSSATGRVEHLTSDTANYLNSDIGSNLTLTNCLLVGIATLGNYSVLEHVNIESNASGVFQTMGAGSHYLVNSSTNRNSGVSTLNANLRTDLQRLTTYPPILYSNLTVSASSNWNPQVLRDTDTPDIGYHYDPIDCAVSSVTVTNATLFLTDGVAVAGMGGSVFKVRGGAAVLSQGTATNMNRLTLYSMVQEQPILWGTAVSKVFEYVSSSGTAPILRFWFTDCSLPISTSAGNCQFYSSPSSPLSELSFKDSWLRTVYLSLNQQNSFNTLVTLTNNLVERCNLSLVRDGAYYLSTTVYFRNNLFYRVNLTLTYNINPFVSGTYSNWVAYDNMFHGVTLTESGNVQSNILNQNNGYLTFDPRLSGAISNVTMASFTYATGPLGNFYQQSTNLVNRGSRYADVAGLYHHTTQTNQVKETNSVVDIGFHYVAVSNGSPFDADGDSLADYTEDVNGNGAADTGETSWLNPDTDGDGYGDGQELIDGTNPLDPDSLKGLIGRWHFDTTNYFGVQGQVPIAKSNLNLVSSWSSNAVGISNVDSDLRYYLVETNGHTNLNLQYGTIRLWFKPDWSSVDRGGTGPGPDDWSALAEVFPTPGSFWGLYLDPNGTNIWFDAGDGDTWSESLLATISWRSNEWHQLAVSYSSTNSKLFIDGVLVSETNGIAAFPEFNELTVGNDLGPDPAHGTIDELDTFDYPLNSIQILADYTRAWLQDKDGNGMSDLWEWKYFDGTGVNPNGNPDGDGLINLYEYQFGTNPLVNEADPTYLQTYTPLK